jgi:hypothetical protein
MKEVIIATPDYKGITFKTEELNRDITLYLDKFKTMSYKTYWFDEEYDTLFANIKNNLEAMLNSLANSAYQEILDKAEEYPILIDNQRPFSPNTTGAKILAFFLPLGIVMRLISFLFERRLNKDLAKVRKLNNELQLITERL